MSAKVYVVFCMDTEGPCDDPGNPELLADWPKVDHAMDKLFDEEFRNKYPDSRGGHFKIGWFFLTWTGFRTNPRGRDFGYHQVRDHYLARWGDAIRSFGDEECWHYHQPPASGIGNEWGLDWTVSSEYEEIMSRQILDRKWFPVCYRAGGTVMDPISSRWVDSWFPFDYTNRAPLNIPGIVDWSSGVEEWSVYHPDVEDFRKPGAGRRRMARCLDLVTNVYQFDETETVKAFERAKSGKPAIMSFFEHDYRDIYQRIDNFHRGLTEVAARYPDVEWEFAGPVEAVLKYLRAPQPTPLVLEALRTEHTVRIWSSDPLFQAVPWIAVRSADGSVKHIHEGIVKVDAQHWYWDIPESLSWEEIGIAGSTDTGASAVFSLRKDDKPLQDFFDKPLSVHPHYPHSIWEHSKVFPASCITRSSGSAPEMDSVRQAVDILSPLLQPGMSVLDVGCASGHAWHSLKPLGVQYFGIDSYQRGIEIGRHYLAEHGLPEHHLRALPVESLPKGEQYDAVLCLNTLNYAPMYQSVLEIMARAARSYMVIRSNFADETEVRFLPDILLEPGYHTMRAFFNVFGRADIQSFLESEGFEVQWLPDRRQQERFGGQPEVVGGVVFNYEFLVARRVRPTPGDDEILGEYFGEASRQWHGFRKGGPNT